MALTLFPLATSRAAVARATIALSLSNETFRPTSHAAIAACVAPDRRRTSYAFIRLAINLGMSIGPAVGAR